VVVRAQAALEEYLTSACQTLEEEAGTPQISSDHRRDCCKGSGLVSIEFAVGLLKLRLLAVVVI